MSLGKRLGRAALRRVERSPRFQAQKERMDRQLPVHRAAMKAAQSSLDDEQAKAQLEERLEADPPVVEDTLAFLAHLRGDYIGDRAYRLLSACAAGTRVQPIPPEQAQLFAEEAAIGRMPIEQAFRQLAEVEPRLLDLQRNAQTVRLREAPSGSHALPEEMRLPLDRLVGSDAARDSPLLHTDLATSIVHTYLHHLIGDMRLGAPDAAYFDGPRVVVRSSSFRLRKKSDAD